MITDLVSLRNYVFQAYPHAQIEPQFDVLLQLAETDITNDLVSREIEQSVYGDMTDPVIPEPEDISQFQRLVITYQNRELSLDYVAPGELERMTGYPGTPRAFSVLDQSIQIYPSPNQTYRYHLYYIPKPKPLTTAEPTNDLLVRAPTIYVYAICRHAAIFLQDDQSAGRYTQLYGGAWRDYKSASDRMVHPLKTPMRIRMRSATH